MRAMVLEEFNKPLVLKEIPIPDIGDDEILVKMKVCSICNTDNKIKSGLVPVVKPPAILGHEPSGIVIKTGRNVKTPLIGQKVTFLHFTSCGKCKNCLVGRPNNCTVGYQRLGFDKKGGYAEYMAAPAANAFVVPDDFSLEYAALIPDAICTSIHALYDQVKIQAGELVLIVGAGGLGIHALQVAKAAGTTVIVSDISDKKLERALKLGADYVVNPSKQSVPDFCKSINNGEGVDVSADFIGLKEASEQAFHSLRLTGRMVMVGYAPKTTFNVSSEDVAMGERVIIGSKNRLYHNLATGLKLILEGKVIPQIDERFHFTKANDALDKLANVGFIGRGILLFD